MDKPDETRCTMFQAGSTDGGGNRGRGIRSERCEKTQSGFQRLSTDTETGAFRSELPPTSTIESLIQL